MAFPVVELCASLINSQKAIWEGEGEKNKTLIKDFVEKTPSNNQASKTSAKYKKMHLWNKGDTQQLLLLNAWD